MQGAHQFILAIITKPMTNEPGQTADPPAISDIAWPLRAIAFAFALFFRHVSNPRITAIIWINIIRPYIIWRRLEFITRTKFGSYLHVCFPDAIQTYLYFFGIWEPTITRYIQLRLKPGDTFIDVGANIGYYSLLASRIVGSEGVVHAIEAIPSVYDILCRNIHLNKALNVSAHNVAVTGVARIVTIFSDPRNPGTSTIIKETADRNGGTLPVNVIGKPLDQIVDSAALRDARFIKIDVEGAEWEIVKSLAELLKTTSDQTEILIEVNTSAIESYGGTVEEFLKLFYDAGFKAFVIENQYVPEFYSRRVSAEVRPLMVPFISGQLDLVFRRNS